MNRTRTAPPRGATRPARWAALSAVVLNLVSPSATKSASTTVREATVATEPDTGSRKLARVAGVLYLMVAIFGGFAQGFVYPKVYAAGDAAATARNLVQHAGLVRLAVVSDLTQATLWILLALTLVRLFHRVNEPAARAVAVFTAIGAGITMLDTVFELEAMRAATDAIGPYAAGVDSLPLVLADIHHFGLVVAQVFFGLWLLPLGRLALRSGWFPTSLGVLLVVGGACYLVDTLVTLVAPDLGAMIHGPLVIPCVVAEVWMVGYLLVGRFGHATAGADAAR